MEFNAYLAAYEHRYPHFKILGTALPCFPPNYFGDGAHLNPRGARTWSELVRQELNAASPGQAPLVPENDAHDPQSYDLAPDSQSPRNCTAMLQLK